LVQREAKVFFILMLFLLTSYCVVANRLLLVGDLNRANTIAQFLDEKPTFCHVSSRGFYTITGTYQGVPVTILGTGMGYPMVDFSIRECRAIVDGPMAMIRLGKIKNAKKEMCALPTDVLCVFHFHHVFIYLFRYLWISWC
jgi:hypothetical protein